MGLTFYTLFYGQDLWQIQRAVLQMSPVCLILAAGLALFFVSAEGTMIWYLLRSMEGKSGLMRCIAYSFIGFFLVLVSHRRQQADSQYSFII